MAQILVFGDSITLGAWDVEGGWADRLKKFLNKRTLSTPEFWNTDFIEVFNLGISSISGENSGSLLERFESEAKRRLDEYETIIIIAVGKNDSCFLENKKSFLTPPKQFEKNIQRLIELSRKYSSKIVFVGTAMVDESKAAPIHWDKNMFYRNEHLKQYNDIIKSVCDKSKVHFIEISEAFGKQEYKKLLADGLHPNSKGHELIFNIVKEFLLKEKII